MVVDLLYTGYMNYSKVDEIRFWSKVAVSNRNNACWHWKASKHRFGYGYFRISKKTYTAHRLALIFFSGIEEKELNVLHSCDNPSCCNPLHLRWGTDLENHLDAVKRKRHVSPPRNCTKPPIHYGINNFQTKMTEDMVLNLRKDRYLGLNYKELSTKYKISYSTVSQICNYKTWKYI